MSDKTGIEWTDATWNPVRGCTRVSDGCRNCYAEAVAARFSGQGMPYEGLAKRTSAGPRWTGKVVLAESALEQPLRWRKPRRIFVNSMSDLFHESIPDEWIDRVFTIMALCPHHIFQVLTKRPERMLDYLVEREDREIGRAMDRQLSGPVPVPVLQNVWLGVSVEDQATADERIPHLLATPAAIRFISVEPLLEAVDLRITQARGTSRVLDALTGNSFSETSLSMLPRGNSLDWVIVGGESGPKARPMHPDWARSLRDQCAAADVPFFFKQWGEWAPWDDDNWSLPEGCDDVEARDHARTVGGIDFLRVGKRRAGRRLDRKEHNGMPSLTLPR